MLNFLITLPQSTAYLYLRIGYLRIPSSHLHHVLDTLLIIRGLLKDLSNMVQCKSLFNIMCVADAAENRTFRIWRPFSSSKETRRILRLFRRHHFNSPIPAYHRCCRP